MSEPIKTFSTYGEPIFRPRGRIVQVFRRPMEAGENPADYLARCRQADSEMAAAGFEGVQEASAEAARRS